MFLLDTNVISEIGKGHRCNVNVAAWYRNTRDNEIFLSVLVVGEIRQGIERVRPRDSKQARGLERWLDEVVESFGDRILPLDQSAAQRWGRINARYTLPVIDSLMAATALARDLTLVTRNISDIERSGVRFLNPFEPS
jgi:toxin FitB